MDKSTLVKYDIEAGHIFLRQLEEEGLPIAAAMWLKTPEQPAWQLIVATPDVEARGPIFVYKLIDRALRKSNLTALSLDDIIAANTTNHYVNAVARGLAALVPSGPTYQIANKTLNGVFVEGALVYRLAPNVRPSKSARKRRTAKAAGAKKRSRSAPRGVAISTG